LEFGWNLDIEFNNSEVHLCCESLCVMCDSSHAMVAYDWRILFERGDSHFKNLDLIWIISLIENLTNKIVE